ncbi:MAG: hypothetical protein HY063_15030 [Bacteroidetes bacterium]|nr:hypothetical protein [Bacteroidota bacterium]
MMRAFKSILLIFVFGVYSFTFKTHYCFYPSGERFHGDCQAHIKKSSGRNLYPNHYICYDFLKNAQTTKSDNSFIKISSQKVFIAENNFQNVKPIYISDFFVLPEFNCRGGPPLTFISLRAPPFC